MPSGSQVADLAPLAPTVLSYVLSFALVVPDLRIERVLEPREPGPSAGPDDRRIIVPGVR